MYQKLEKVKGSKYFLNALYVFNYALTKHLIKVNTDIMIEHLFSHHLATTQILYGSIVLTNI
jgi:hypothetical protein